MKQRCELYVFLYPYTLVLTRNIESVLCACNWISYIELLVSMALFSKYISFSGALLFFSKLCNTYHINTSWDLVVITKRPHTHRYLNLSLRKSACQVIHIVQQAGQLYSTIYFSRTKVRCVFCSFFNGVRSYILHWIHPKPPGLGY